MDSKLLVIFGLILGAHLTTSFICQGVDFLNGRVVCKFKLICIQRQYQSTGEDNLLYLESCPNLLMQSECKLIETGHTYAGWMTQEKPWREAIVKVENLQPRNLSITSSSNPFVVPARVGRSAFRYFFPATTMNPQPLTSGADATGHNHAIYAIRKEISQNQNKRLVWICSIIGSGVGILILVICICTLRRWLPIVSEIRTANVHQGRPRNLPGNIQRLDNRQRENYRSHNNTSL